MNTFDQLKNLPPHQKAAGVNSWMGDIHQRDEFLKTVDTNHWCGGVIPSENGKFIMVENGEPACACSHADRSRFVVMPWREFEAMCGNVSSPAHALYTGGRVHFAEVVDEVLDVPACALRVGKPAYAPVRRSFVKLAVDTEKIRLEDLPI